MSALNFCRALAIALVLSLFQGTVFAQSLSKRAAIALAEKSIAENGYTNLPPEKVKAILDPESLEFGGSREKVLARRFNTLKPKAIGVKAEAKGQSSGWSVAFDFVGASSSSPDCRVVTMEPNGSDIRVQHVDGMRSYFVGFE